MSLAGAAARRSLRARGARDAPRPVHGDDPDRRAARGALVFGSCSRPRSRTWRSASSTRARRAASRRLVAELAANGTLRPAPLRDARRARAALVAGDDQRRARHPARLRPRLLARRAGRPAARDPGALRRRRDRARRQRRGLPARHRRARPARDAARVAARRRRGRGGVAVVTQRALQPDARRHAVHGRRAPSASCSRFLTTLITAVSIVNERLARHLRAAPGDARDVARDPARQDAAARRRVRVRRRADDARRRASLLGVWPQRERALLRRRLVLLRAHLARRSGSSSRRPRRPPPRPCRRRCSSASR